MLKNIHQSLKNSLVSLNRLLDKLFVGPFKYGRADGYDAHRYWQDRFFKYGGSLKGTGNEGLTEQENKILYSETAGIVREILGREAVDLRLANVLEIGCGSGFYAQMLYDLGVRRYCGIDITDALFDVLKNKFTNTGYGFVRRDVTLEPIEGSFDLILMINVTEHIVSEAGFSFALGNVKNCLADRGVFIIGPVMKISKRRFFYLRLWSMDDVRRNLPGCSFGQELPLRGGYMLAVRKADKVR